MNISTRNFQVESGLGWGHWHYHHKINEFAESLCKKCKTEGLDCLQLLTKLSDYSIPVKIMPTIWTGTYEGKIYRNSVVEIKVGTENTRLMVFCDN